MANFKAFKHVHQIQSAAPLSDDEIRRFAPSIFGGQAHVSRTERYTYIPTSEILAGLRKEGFQPFFACQSVVRDQTRREYTRHMLRLRHEAAIDTNEANEIVLGNAHDGTSAYQLFAGVLNFVCTNGLVVGDCVDEVKIPHKGDVMGKVIEGVYTVLDTFDRVDESKDGMKAITLSGDEQRLFARSALQLRYDPADGPAPITETQVLEARRHADSGPDLWSVFNRIEENLCRGGLTGQRPGHRRYTTRGVNAIDKNVALNRALWTLAEGMNRLKSE
jgi:Domain of unknown function (DUF932)